MAGAKARVDAAADGSGPLAGLLSPSSPKPPACGWQEEADGCGELVMRYGVIHLQVTSSKPGQQWVKVPDQGGHDEVSFECLKGKHLLS